MVNLLVNPVQSENTSQLWLRYAWRQDPRHVLGVMSGLWHQPCYTCNIYTHTPITPHFYW